MSSIGDALNINSYDKLTSLHGGVASKSRASSMMFSPFMEGIDFQGSKVWLVVGGITLVLVKAILLLYKGMNLP